MPARYETVRKVAEQLGVSIQTVRAMINRGTLLAIKTAGLKGKWIVEIDSLERYLAKSRLEALERGQK